MNPPRQAPSLGQAAGPAKPTAASRRTESRPFFLRRWVQDHVRVLVFSLGQLARAPLATLLSAAVIGITLALPTGLHLLLDNFSRVSVGWERSTQASLFLKDSVSEERGRNMAGQLARRSEVADTRYISRKEALEEFRLHSGFGAAVDLLEENPLPAVIMVQPRADVPPSRMESLVRELRQQPEIESAQLDQTWLKRLHAILDIVQRVVQVIAVLLGIAVVIVIGNTIRLDIQNRRDEIIVMKLLGAPNSFIRRPFLYTGFWYGLLGGLLAWLLLQTVLWSLGDSVAQLAGLYSSDYRLGGLDLNTSLTLFVASIGLGLLGSGWTVGRHLEAIEPR